MREVEDREERRWGMYLHLSQFAGYLIPLAGFLVPIVIWQVKKDEMPSLDRHGRIVVNWMITELIGAAAIFLFAITVLLIPVAILLGILLALASVAFPVIGAIKAEGGVVWPYPASVKIV